MQLQNAKEKFAQQNIKFAAISYDSPAILKDFATRHKIDFPLLGDPHSEVIRNFHVLNAEAKGMTSGMARPGFYLIDPNGVIREAYFVANYADRLTPNSFIAKLFPELTEEVRQNVDAPHLKLTAAASDHFVSPGSRITLSADIELPPDVHVYSPGVQGYKPVQLMLPAVPGIAVAPAIYPVPNALYLAAIKETVPVFNGKFRVSQDVTIIPSKTGDIVRSLLSSEKTITISGSLQYQACDQTTCYPPATIPLAWQLQVIPLDLTRSPTSIRHK